MLLDLKKSNVFIYVFACLWLLNSSYAIAQRQDSVSFGRFGKVTLYQSVQQPTALVLFISGDGGWQHGVINMGRFLAQQGALVAGIDAKHFAKAMKQTTGCLYPAADFEQLSMMLQKKFKFQSYLKPIIVGYSYGATLAYGLLAQSPAGTFKGAIALGFCPDIDLNRPLCAGSGLKSHVLKPGKSYYLDRIEKLNAPFIVLNGLKDQTCPFDATATFLKGIDNAELVTLTKVGHGFSIGDNWLPQFKAAFLKIQSAGTVVTKEAVKLAIPHDLPISETFPKGKTNHQLVFMISGDGGWTSFDQGLADAFATKGYVVLGLDAQKYFWNAKTPDGTTKELSLVIAAYMQKLTIDKFILAGYSFGACVVPFIASRLPENLRPGFRALVSFSPDQTADFEIHVADMLNFGGGTDPYNVISEMGKLDKVTRLCLFGSEEDQNIIRRFKGTGAKILSIPGGHHYNEDYGTIVESVLKEI